MAQDNKQIANGIYNVDYYSGAQVGIYIGDTWVDEVTSISYSVQQNRRPLYDYASSLFKGVSKGPVLVQGQFTINFKEAGYLWLVLDRYQTIMNGRASKMQDLGFKGSHKQIEGISSQTPFGFGNNSVLQQNIERIINAEEVTAFTRNKTMEDLAKIYNGNPNIESKNLDQASVNKAGLFQVEDAQASLTGFSSIERSNGSIGTAESVFESFENVIWRRDDEELNQLDRRPDDPDLNPFDIYIAYGDFAGDDQVNHTIRKLDQVHILGQSQRIIIDGQPIQESYSFIARNII